MSENLSDKTFCVFDHFGLFVGLAQRLSKSGARVLYCTPVDRYDRLNEAIIGDGLDGIEWVEELWDNKKETDCFVFPDIRHAGLQNELREQGLPVWGSHYGMKLEQSRIFFLSKLKELGLDVAPHEIVVGVSNLKAFLHDKNDIWIKVSKWRGTWETQHWRSWNQDSQNLDAWAVKFGGKKEKVQFICFEKIETDLEIGADTYCVDGRWPSTMLHGLEIKDSAYLSAVTPRDEMPEQILPIMEAFSPYLKEMDTAISGAWKSGSLIQTISSLMPLRGVVCRQQGASLPQKIRQRSYFTERMGNLLILITVSNSQPSAW